MTKARTNGHARRIPDVVSRIELAGVYEGFWIDVRANAPIGTFLDITDMKVDDKSLPKILELLAEVGIATNLVDHRGEPVDVTSALGWRKGCGLDLIGMAISKFPEAMQRPFVKPTTSSSPTSSDTATTRPGNSA